MKYIKQYVPFLHAYVYSGLVQDFYMRFQRVFMDNSRTEIKIFKELYINIHSACVNTPKPSDYDLRIRDTLSFPKVKLTKYGIKSFRFLGPKNWNSLPYNLKLSNNTRQFKTLICNWFSNNQCACMACNQ